MYKNLLCSHLEEHHLACRCFESLEESNDTDNPSSIIRFHCAIPPILRDENSDLSWISLSFDCRAPSCGALKIDDGMQTNRRTATNQDNFNETHVINEWNAVEDEAVDPHLFDPGYTLAGRTGFQVWAGARLLLEYCLAQHHVLSNKRIIELGAGVGLVGTAVAVRHTNVQVLLTDLPTLVEHSLEPNLKRNHQQFDTLNATTNAPPKWLVQTSSSLPVSFASSSWVGTACLDWTRSVADQLSIPDDAVDLILASDCVWLVSMLDSLLDTADALMGRDTQFWLSFQKREFEGSSSGRMFTTIDSILNAIVARSWNWTCVAWRPVHLVDGQVSEAFVLEISKSNQNSR